MNEILALQLNKIVLAHDKLILDQADLSINENEFVVITGSSGIGKSSLFNMILGLKKQKSGSVKVFDEELSADTIKNIRSKISWLPQKFELMFRGIVKDFMIELFNHNELKVNSERILTEFNLLDLPEELLNKDFSELSSGEKQRVAAIICKLLDKEIMLLDEPSSNLDSNNRKKIIDYLLENRKTIITITHDEELMKLASKKYIIENRKFKELK